MNRNCLSLFLIMLLSGMALSQVVNANRVEKEITMCPVKLLAQAANFRFSYRYAIKTDKSGAVTKIEQIGKENPKFIQDEEFIPCIKTWKLNPSEDYFVMFYLGTNTSIGKNYISIGNEKEMIKVNMGTIGPQLILDQNKRQ